MDIKNGSFAILEIKVSLSYVLLPEMKSFVELVQLQ